MRVLVVSATFPPMSSGGADYTFHLCRHLAAQGLEVQVLTSVINNVATHPDFRVSPSMRYWSWPELPRLLRAVRSYSPDVVDLHFHGHIYRNHPMITFAPTLIKRACPNVGVVTHIEYPVGVMVRALPRWTRVVRKLVVWSVGADSVDYEYGTLLRDSDRIIVLSDTHRMILSRHFAGLDQKCTLIPPPPLLRIGPEDNGEARTEGRRLIGATPDHFVIAYFGYIYPGKGIETLLHAFSLVAPHGNGGRLIVIGGTNDVVLEQAGRPQYMSELHDLANQLNISDKVTWTGYYPTDSDRPSLYFRAADLCVLPFEAGAFMNNSSLAAAAAHGLPIITTRGPVIEAPLIDRENVLLCTPNDPHGLSQAIELVIRNPDMHQRLRAGALALAREWFSWETGIRRTIDAFGAR